MIAEDMIAVSSDSVRTSEVNDSGTSVPNRDASEVSDSVRTEDMNTVSSNSARTIEMIAGDMVIDDVVQLIWEWLDMRTLIYFQSTCRKHRTFSMKKYKYYTLAQICMVGSYVDLVHYRGTREFAMLSMSDTFVDVVAGWMLFCIRRDNPRFCDALLWVLLFNDDRVDELNYDELYDAAITCCINPLSRMSLAKLSLVHMLPTRGNAYNAALLRVSASCSQGSIAVSDSGTSVPNRNVSEVSDSVTSVPNRNVSDVWYLCEHSDHSNESQLSRTRANVGLLSKLVKFDDVLLLNRWLSVMGCGSLSNIAHDDYAMLWKAVVRYDAINVARAMGKKGSSLSDCGVAVNAVSRLVSEWDTIKCSIDYNDCCGHRSIADMVAMVDYGGDPQLMLEWYLISASIGSLNPSHRIVEFIHHYDLQLSVSDAQHVIRKWGDGIHNSVPSWVIDELKIVVNQRTCVEDRERLYQLACDVVNERDWEVAMLECCSHWIPRDDAANDRLCIRRDALIERFKQLCKLATVKGKIMIAKRMLTLMSQLLKDDTMRSAIAALERETAGVGVVGVVGGVGVGVSYANVRKHLRL